MNKDTNTLLCDAGLPLAGGGSLREELLLFNVPASSTAELIREFTQATGRTLDPDCDVSILSGGQKVLLMCLGALFSPAQAIRFLGLWHSLDPGNRDRVRLLIDRLGQGRQISFTEDYDAGA